MSSHALPAFESRDPYPFQLLPDGVHVADEVTFRERLVSDFPDSTTRPILCDGLYLLRQDAVKQHIAATQWIDGSFVESKLDPEDIDLVSFVGYDSLMALDQKAKEFAANCLHGIESTKPKYQCHTFMVLCCSPDHEYFPTYEKLRAYWRKWFGQTRDEPIRPGPTYPRMPKGIVEMSLGEPTAIPWISRERSPS